VTPLIEVKGLKTVFQTEDGMVRAVDGVDFAIPQERVLGLVGESGCGKSVTALSIMGLIPTPPGRIAGGEILYHRNGETVDLSRQPGTGPFMRTIRGNEIAMIFQEPMTSLNPVFTVGYQIMEAVMLHQKLGRRAARATAIEMLRIVGIPAPEERVDAFPHQLSGGMRQRAMIAMALSCHPRLLIADEPTTALDVTIQAQVLDLMRDLQRTFKTSLLFITHDLGVIASMADEVAVMYLGRVVEKAPVRELFHHPLHPYTRGLLASLPSLNSAEKTRLVPIKGMVPSLLSPPRGCGFEPRCPSAIDRCREHAPALTESAPGHAVACWLAGGSEEPRRAR
jgi:peptide/nickel transport system ATP-binding protein